MPDNRRHTEFFGPDLSRGPFTSNSPAVASVQLATNLAQLRTPLLRSDSELLAHAGFIRQLADALFPDSAEQIRIEVGTESANTIVCTIREDSGTYSLLHVWLADAKGAGESSAFPTGVTISGATILQTITGLKRYLLIMPTSGVATISIEYNLNRTWYLAVARHGRVFYSNGIDFD